ncbi:MAG: hypothetical protein M0R80_26195 [Proteobacteria bacterium]|jgi:hypothetical protein|nr:hypothetical protein [Pseudomonadota bacterium]
MSDGKADGPYLNRVEPAPCFDFDVSYVVGPKVKVNAENIGVEHLNAAWHSRDAEVDALRQENERIKAAGSDLLNAIAYISDHSDIGTVPEELQRYCITLQLALAQPQEVKP